MVTVSALPRTCTLRITERQAQALAGLILAADLFRGEGRELEDIYIALVDSGAEVEEVSSDIENGLVVVTREDVR